MKIMDYTVLFEPLEDGIYMVLVPALPGVITYGENLENARQMAVDAIKCHLEGLLIDGEPIPEDVNIQYEPVKEKLTIQVG
jgi:predicted RNase H-like HicB family nuclease